MPAMKGFPTLRRHDGLYDVSPLLNLCKLIQEKGGRKGATSSRNHTRQKMRSFEFRKSAWLLCWHHFCENKEYDYNTSVYAHPSFHDSFTPIFTVSLRQFRRVFPLLVLILRFVLLECFNTNLAAPGAQIMEWCKGVWPRTFWALGIGTIATQQLNEIQIGGGRTVASAMQWCNACQPFLRPHIQTLASCSMSCLPRIWTGSRRFIRASDHLFQRVDPMKRGGTSMVADARGRATHHVVDIDVLKGLVAAVMWVVSASSKATYEDCLFLTWSA
jgi:hypothetical protein